MHSGEEFHHYKTNLFPDGISKHGEIYLHNPFKSTGPNLSYTPNELLLETTFELIRQLKYLDKKSRFVCSFGCLTLQDAEKIKTVTFNNHGTIYKVACEHYSLADMNFLKQAGSVIGLQIVAEKYWSGQFTNLPFLGSINGMPRKNIGKGFIAREKNSSQHGVWRYWGGTLLTSAAVRYPLKFRLDVNNLALVIILNF